MSVKCTVANVCLAVGLPSSACIAAELPATFVNNRIYITAVAEDGSKPRIYTDSAGGWNAISTDVANRLDLPVTGETKEDDGSTLRLVDFPKFLRDAKVPEPLNESWLTGHLAVVPSVRMLGEEGMLGNRWFGGQRLLINYRTRHLSSLPDSSPVAGSHAEQLNFKTSADGKRKTNFARITVEVDGAPIDVLLDTGAAAKVTPSSAAQFGVSAGTYVGTSYIVKSIYDRWHQAHPDWKSIESAEDIVGTTFPMIRVPSIKIAGIKAGPVWFTERTDATFHEYMAQMMDKPVEGAIGGSALQYFKIVLDYPKATAYFAPAE